MYRIAIATRGLAVEYFTYLNRLAEPLSDYSIRLVAPELDHDLLFTDDASLLDRFESPEEIDRPIVVFERKDAAVVQPKLRRWLAHPNVKLWLKTTVFRNPPDNNLPTASGHLHVDWIRAAEGQDVVATRMPIEIATSDLSKSGGPGWNGPAPGGLGSRLVGG